MRSFTQPTVPESGSYGYGTVFELRLADDLVSYAQVISWGVDYATEYMKEPLVALFAECYRPDDRRALDDVACGEVVIIRALSIHSFPTPEWRPVGKAPVCVPWPDPVYQIGMGETHRYFDFWGEPVSPEAVAGHYVPFRSSHDARGAFSFIQHLYGVISSPFIFQHYVPDAELSAERLEEIRANAPSSTNPWEMSFRDARTKWHSWEVRVPLSTTMGTEEERANARLLEDELEEALEGLAEIGGHEIGEGQFVIYLSAAKGSAKVNAVLKRALKDRNVTWRSLS